MALIKSNILAQISGSINGITFSHNAGGQYARNRSIPTNPGTDRQDQVRTALTSIAITWRDVLTEDQRELWRSFGQALNINNRLGDQIRLSGIAAFQHVNLFRLATLGASMLLTPPNVSVLNSPPAFDSVTTVAVATNAGLLLNLTSATYTNFGVAAYISGLISPGRKYYRGPYPVRIIDTTAAATNQFDTGIDETVADGYGLAGKFTLYHVPSGTPIWTVATDATIFNA